MFEVKQTGGLCWYISDGNNNYMHRDGEIVPNACEYWPTKELAQAVLDKFRPEHVWVHGDVLETSKGHPMIFVDGRVHYLTIWFPISDPTNLSKYTKDATFLFNIKSKL